MFRLLGFLIGSVAALTIILLVLGIPEFHLNDSGIDQQRFDAAVQKLKEKRQEVAVLAQREAVESLPAPDLIDDYPAIQEELQWYSFWNPFRSEIAARGFVSQLEKVTGLDYRVVKVKTGVYEVAFAYDNDAERRTKLSQISAATGLDLPDS